jgi:hypothetical protein
VLTNRDVRMTGVLTGNSASSGLES